MSIDIINTLDPLLVRESNIGDMRLRDVTAVQWRAFFAAFLGWLLDGFDFSILTFLLIDIQHSFSVDKALAGAPGYCNSILSTRGRACSWDCGGQVGSQRPPDALHRVDFAFQPD